VIVYDSRRLLATCRASFVRPPPGIPLSSLPSDQQPDKWIESLPHDLDPELTEEQKILVEKAKERFVLGVIEVKHVDW
jgi:hypothetical protein